MAESPLNQSIPFSPNPGHELLDDSDLGAHPSCPFVGHVSDLAETGCAIAGLSYKGTQR